MTSGNQSIVKFQTLALGHNFEQETKTQNREPSIVVRESHTAIMHHPVPKILRTQQNSSDYNKQQKTKKEALRGDDFPLKNACVCLLAQTKLKKYKSELL